MKVPELLLGLIIGVAVAGLFNFAYRNQFVNRLKGEPMDVQAQYKLNRIKAILETYDNEVT